MLRGADPTKRNPPGAGLSEKSKAEFPPEKMAEFEGGPPGSVPSAETPALCMCIASFTWLLARSVNRFVVAACTPVSDFRNHLHS